MKWIKNFLLWLHRLFEKDGNVNPPPNPNPNPPDLGVYITSDEAEKIIRASLKGKLATSFRFYAGDETYYCPSIEYTKKILSEDKTDEFRWSKDYFDCFLPETALIAKIDGKETIISIEELYDVFEKTDDITVLDLIDGEMTWTKANWIKKKKSNKNIAVVRGRNGFIEVTEDHKFCSPYLRFDDELNDGFYEISTLGKMPKLIGINDAENIFKNDSDISDELAYALGVFMAEGHAKQHKKKTTDFSWSWHIDMGELWCLERIKPHLEKWIGIDLDIVLYDSQKKGSVRGGLVAKCDVYRLKTTSNYGDGRIACEKFIPIFYNKFEDKVIPDIVLRAGKSAKLAFIDGYCVGDGYVDKDNSIRCCCVSRSGTLGLYLLAKECAIDTYCAYDNRKNENKRTCPIVIFSNPGNHNNIVEIEDRGEITVYDINTKSGHLYAGGFLVHNCEDFSRLVWAAFARDAYRNGTRRAAHAVGMMWGRLPKPHSINFVINDDKKLRLIEPQNDNLFMPNENQRLVWLMIV